VVDAPGMEEPRRADNRERCIPSRFESAVGRYLPPGRGSSKGRLSAALLA